MADLNLLPGYVTEQSPRGARGRWKDGNYARFGKNGQPKKMGGIVQQSGSAFSGKCRRMRPFVSFNRQKYLALATHLKFYIYQDGDMSDVTPYISTGTLTDPFSTTAASAVVTVADASHGLSAGDYVHYTGATVSPIDSINITGEYTVTSVIDANTYTITHSVVATNSEASFGGAGVDFSYEIPIGNENNSVGAGFGGSTFGTSTFGTPRTSSGITNIARTVAIDGWGEDVLFSPKGKPIYIWDTSTGVGTRAQLISQAPSTNEFIVVSPEDRHLISLGAHDGANSDPMLVRWCSQEDYTLWTPSATNTAGDKRLDQGNRIMTGAYVRKQILILTDTSAYGMFFVGYLNGVFGIDHLRSGCGAISSNCMAEADDVVRWMGDDNFFEYDGTVRELPCDVHNYVFGNFNKAQKDLVTCGVNSAHNEIWWKYPSAGSNEVDRVVIYNYFLKCWYYFTLQQVRTAMIDKSSSFSVPMAAGSDGYLYAMESGSDENGVAISSYVESHDISREDGKNMFISRLILDFLSISGTVNAKLRGKIYPMDSAYTEKGPVVFSGSVSKKNIRIRKTQVSLRIYSDQLSDNWEVGTIQADTQPMGMR